MGLFNIKPPPVWCAFICDLRDVGSYNKPLALVGRPGEGKDEVHRRAVRELPPLQHYQCYVMRMSWINPEQS